MTQRYIPIPPGLSPKEAALAVAAAIVADGGFGARYYTPENLCVTCGHPRNSHLDQAEVRGGEKTSDRGWCTRPENSCIYQGCPCLEFVEPPEPAHKTYVWSQVDVQTVMSWIDAGPPPFTGAARTMQVTPGGIVTLRYRTLAGVTWAKLFMSLGEAAEALRRGHTTIEWYPDPRV